MSKKSAKIAALIEQCRGRELPAHYLGYFECFNRGLFYEAHDVLEELWLAERGGPNDAFFKGLIQFAGAFVHLQKGRLRPAAALFTLSQKYLGGYASPHLALDVAEVLRISREWVGWLEAGTFARNPFDERPPPQITPRT
jgi:predicted metal-dependent hydrolase